MMEQHMNATNIRPEHNGYVDIAEKDKGKLIVGSVRNPYSWYVSLYHNHVNDEGSFFRETFENTNGFSEWVKKFLTLNYRVYHDLNFSTLSQMDIGPYSYRMLVCYADEVHNSKNLVAADVVLGDISFIKTDDLALDFVSAIENNIGMDIKVKEAILTADHIHTSTHGHYRDYYDAEALELVAHKDRLIFELFEYERE
jgi:hypothetical protein